MLRKNASQMLFAVAILAVVAMAGCAAKKEMGVEQDPGLSLIYRMLEDQVLKYQMTSQNVQNLEIMGQSVKIETHKAYGFSIKSKGMEESNHQLEFTIDSVAIHINGPQGGIPVNVNAVLGKSFDMTFSPLGEELDLAGAKSLRYDMGIQGKQSIAPDFQMIFPDLPGEAIEIGDTWSGKNALDIGEGESWVHIDMDTVNTLEGFETIDGLECVRIVSEVTGTVDGQGKQEGIDLVTKGNLKGTDTWYFAHRDGIFVKLASDIDVHGTITGTGQQNIEIPLTQEFHTNVVLAK
jgi:hypothetical protein